MVFTIDIISCELRATGSLKKRKDTNYIVIHEYSGNSVDIDALNEQHINNGWTTLGYHYVVDADKIYQGREKDAVGMHCLGMNLCSVGILLYGIYEESDQANKLVSNLLDEYPSAKLVVRNG